MWLIVALTQLSNGLRLTRGGRLLVFESADDARGRRRVQPLLGGARYRSQANNRPPITVTAMPITIGLPYCSQKVLDAGGGG